MDYFIVKQLGTASIPKDPGLGPSTGKEPSIRIMEDVSVLGKFDFIASEMLVSDRFKQLLEQYLMEQPWRPCVFIEPPKKAQTTFWFLPPLPYSPSRVSTMPSGLPSAVYVEREDFARKSPGIFRIRSPKGVYSMVVHLSVAESILRRGICGLELARLSV